MNKTFNNKAWWMVLPVFLVVAFNALIPLMTVVNYSVQETFGNNEFFWSGTIWFQQLLENDQIRRDVTNDLGQLRFAPAAAKANVVAEQLYDHKVTKLFVARLPCDRAHQTKRRA